jgi:formate transporter
MTSIRKSDPGLFNMLYGSFGFPFGLTMVVVAGADLFTSNCMYMVAAFAEGKCTLRQWMRVWVLSYLSNLCGALLLMQLMIAGELCIT